MSWIITRSSWLPYFDLNATTAIGITDADMTENTGADDHSSTDAVSSLLCIVCASRDLLLSWPPKGSRPETAH